MIDRRINHETNGSITPGIASRRARGRKIVYMVNLQTQGLLPQKIDSELQNDLDLLSNGEVYEGTFNPETMVWTDCANGSRRHSQRCNGRGSNIVDGYSHNLPDGSRYY